MRAQLQDVAVTTFTTDGHGLAARLPPGVEPWVVPADGGECALVSAVSFRLRDVRVGPVRWPGLDCGHVDYRAYVRFDGDPAVWFLGAAMASRLSFFLRRLWSMPWHRATVDLTAGERYGLRVVDGAADVELRARPPDGRAPSALEGFASPGEADALLVNPTVGLFAGRRGVRRYEVHHAPLEGRVMVPETARIGLFERLGLVAPEQPPHSVLALPDFAISVRLPPRSA